MNRTQRGISLVLALLLACTLLAPVSAASGPEEISDAAGLAAMQSAGDYVLVDDIVIDPAAPWTRLPSFTGTLDGDGYTISGLTDALFESISGATISNLNLEVDIRKEIDPSITAEQKAAAVAYNMSGGTIENVHVSGRIYLRAQLQTMGAIVGFMGDGHAVIRNCSFDGEMESHLSYTTEAGKASNVGGLIGCAYWNSGQGGSIANNTMTGRIQVNGSNTIYVGGIAGQFTSVNNSTSYLEYCRSGAAITIQAVNKVYAGGIAGYTAHQSYIRYCAAEGVSITAAATTDAQVGGIAGYILKNSRVFDSFSVGGTYQSTASDAGKDGYAGAILGGTDGGDQAIYVEELIAINNVVTADIAGGIVGFRCGNSQVKNAFYTDDTLPHAGRESGVNLPTINVGVRTLAQLRDRATYDTLSDPDDPTSLPYWENFGENWIIPAGGNPTLLWMVENAPADLRVVDATATRPDGEGFQYGADIGRIGTHFFPALAPAVDATSPGGTIQIAANVSDYTFSTGGYAVTLAAGGGKIASVARAADGSVTLPAITRSGYTFSGWRLEDATHGAGDTVALTGDAVFAAQWQAISTGGGSTPPPPPPPPEPEVVVKENPDGSKTETVVTETKTNPETGIASTLGKTTTTGADGNQTTAAFAEVKLTLAESTAVTDTVVVNLIAAVKEAESTAAASGDAVSSVLALVAPAQGNAAAVTLPQSALSAVVRETTASLLVSAGVGEIQLNPAALDAIAQASDGAASVTMRISQVSPEQLPEAQEAVAAGGKAFVIEINAVAEDGSETPIHGLGGGEQIVRLPYTPEEGEDISNLIVYYIDEEGNPVKMGGVYNPANGYVEFSTNHNSLYLVVHEAAARFTDVTLSNWYYTGVNYTVGRGMMKGVSADAFAPAWQLSRAMLVTILYRLEGEPETGGGGFADIPAGEWYSEAVAWAENYGIVKGVGDGTFRPELSITREQMATILYRYAMHKGLAVGSNAPLTAFADGGAVSDDMVGSMEWAVTRGLINGITPTTLEPQGVANRAQVATILSRFCNMYGL